MSIKTIFLLSYFIAFLAPQAFAQRETLISGKFDDIKRDVVVNIRSDRGSFDSVIAKEGVFSFKVDSLTEACTYFISAPLLSKAYMYALFVKRGTQIHLQVDKDLEKFRITGDKVAQEQNEFYKAWENSNAMLSNLKKEAATSIDSMGKFGLDMRLAKAVKMADQFCPDWVYAHPQSPFSVAVIRMYISTFNINMQNKDSLAEKCFSMLSHDATVDNYESFLLKRDFVLQGYDRYATVEDNRLAPNFIIKDTSGRVIRMNDLRGKYLLIDFWASWCGPCRKESPYLKRLYDKYRNRGLIVLSISIDTDSKAWRKAIKDDNMVWLQGSDLLGQSYGVGNSYQIAAVPKLVFIGKDGIVISAVTPNASDNALHVLIDKYL